MWNTNFPLWQEGSWSEKVRIWPVDKQSKTVPNLVQNAWEARLPLLTGVAEGTAGKLPLKKKGIAISRGGVLLTAFGENPDGKGTILRLWEQGGSSAAVQVTLPKEALFTQATPVNLRGEVIGKSIKIINGSFAFDLKAYAPVSFVLN
jgi:hypothetical protein